MILFYFLSGSSGWCIVEPITGDWRQVSLHQAVITRTPQTHNRYQGTSQGLRPESWYRHAPVPRQTWSQCQWHFSQTTEEQRCFVSMFSLGSRYSGLLPQDKNTQALKCEISAASKAYFFYFWKTDYLSFRTLPGKVWGRIKLTGPDPQRLFGS